MSESIVITSGKGGAGKTFYAKKLLKSMTLDFCISSSSNDPLQDYLGQKAIILDDFRDRSFSNFEDCLKLLDNNTSSSVQSRFHNKVFNGELIIITTNVPLHYWYRGKSADGRYYNVANEDFVQLYRRISCYVEVTTDEIMIYNDIDSNGRPTGLAQVYKNELADLKKEKQEKRDFGALFGKICEPSKTDVFDIEQLRIGDENKRQKK